MRYIDFSTNRTALIQKSGIKDVVPGTSGYLGCRFKVDSDWEGCKLIAVFSNKNIEEMPVRVASDGTCYIPDEITDEKEFAVYLIGVRKDLRLKTKPVQLRQG